MYTRFLSSKKKWHKTCTLKLLNNNMETKKHTDYDLPSEASMTMDHYILSIDTANIFAHLQSYMLHELYIYICLVCACGMLSLGRHCTLKINKVAYHYSIVYTQVAYTK